MSLADLSGKNRKIKNLELIFKIFKAKPISSLCIFHYKNEKDARYLKQVMNEAKEEYGIILEKNDFKLVNFYNFKEWTSLIEKCIKTKKNNMVTFFIND